MIILETERLILRNFVMNDLDAMAKIDANPSKVNRSFKPPIYQFMKVPWSIIACVSGCGTMLDFRWIFSTNCTVHLSVS